MENYRESSKPKEVVPRRFSPLRPFQLAGFALWKGIIIALYESRKLLGRFTWNLLAHGGIFGCKVRDSTTTLVIWCTSIMYSLLFGLLGAVAVPSTIRWKFLLSAVGPVLILLMRIYANYAFHLDNKETRLYWKRRLGIIE